MSGERWIDFFKQYFEGVVVKKANGVVDERKEGVKVVWLNEMSKS